MGTAKVDIDEFTRETIQAAARDAEADVDAYTSELLSFAAELVRKGRLDPLAMEPCESARMHADHMTLPEFGFWFQSGEGLDPDTDEPETEKARRVVEEELRREELPAAFQPDREYSLGTGAGWVGFLVAVAAGLTALQNIDNGLAVLKKWLGAIRRAASRLGASGYTAEFLEACCLEEVAQRLGGFELVEPAMISCVAATAPGPMEAAMLVSHYTVTIPLPAQGKAFVFVITQLGEILDSAELNYPVSGSMLEDVKDSNEFT